MEAHEESILSCAPKQGDWWAQGCRIGGDFPRERKCSGLPGFRKKGEEQREGKRVGGRVGSREGWREEGGEERKEGETEGRKDS